MVESAHTHTHTHTHMHEAGNTLRIGRSAAERLPTVVGESRCVETVKVHISQVKDTIDRRVGLENNVKNSKAN